MDSDLPDRLITVGSYSWPTGPASSTARDIYRRIASNLWTRRGAGTAALAPEKRRQLETRFFSDEASRELCETLHRLLDQTYLDWLTRPADKRPDIRVVVTMPSVPDRLIRDWAERRGVMTVDGIDALTAGEPRLLTGLPHLVDRSTAGQRNLRRGVGDLARHDGRLLIAVNGWTWRYLCHASDINLLPVDIKTLPAFPSRALKHLIETHGPERTLRSAVSGDDVLALDRKGRLKDPYLALLAARAYGCPWAGMALIESAVTRGDTEDGAIWLDHPPALHLPEQYGKASMLVLHALLLHDGLEVGSVDRALDQPTPVGLLAALERADLVEQREGRWRCSRTGYPEIRRILADASFPVDAL